MRQLMLPTIENPLDHLYEQRTKLERALLAPHTERSYAHDWKMFSAWCELVHRTSLPATPETISLYLTDELSRGRKVSTAVRRTSGIGHMHRVQGYPVPITPEVWTLLAGARRLFQERPRQMAPLTVEQIRTISDSLAKDGTPIAIRNRAIIVVGFASALRRASIAQLRLCDVEFGDMGALVQVQHEKQDQEGRGRFIGLPFGKHRETCPVSCLKDWLAHRGLNDGPLFTPFDGDRSRHLRPATIGRVVKAGVARIGLDPTKYAGHSLRAGFITEAGEAGVGLLLIAAQSGHRSLDILRRYFRRSDAFKANACAMIGL